MGSLQVGAIEEVGGRWGICSYCWIYGGLLTRRRCVIEVLKCCDLECLGSTVNLK